jgi:hypothetical protein
VTTGGVNGWGKDLCRVTPFPRGAKPPLSRDISPLMTLYDLLRPFMTQNHLRSLMKPQPLLTPCLASQNFDVIFRYNKKLRLWIAHLEKQKLKIF